MPEASDWIDPRFAALDTRTGSETLMESLTRIASEQEPPPAPTPEPVAAEPPPPPAPPAEPQGPKVIQNPDGSTVTIEKTSRGWKATLSAGIGQPEVFYGATKEDMWANVAGSKLHATKKIRELNRKLKMGESPAPPAARATSPASDLTAEERVSLQAKFAADPASAMDEYFTRRFGQTPEQLVQNSQRGVAAQRALTVEEASREFLRQNPGYYNHDDNYVLLVGLLAKQKLGKTLTDANRDEMLNALVDAGHFTATNLTEAYEELNDEGLLHVAPATPPAPEPVVPTPPAPAPLETVPPSTEPARVERRPRAGFGIPPSAASATPPDPGKPPSDQELANMSDADIAALWAGVRTAARARRS